MRGDPESSNANDRMTAMRIRVAVRKNFGALKVWPVPEKSGHWFSEMITRN
jgi:hypothetical protein